MAPKDHVRVRPEDLTTAGNALTSDGASFADAALPSLHTTASMDVPGSLVEKALAQADTTLDEMRQTVSGHLRALGSNLTASAQHYTGSDVDAATGFRDVMDLNTVPRPHRPR